VKILQKLRTASLNSEFTGSHKKKVYRPTGMPTVIFLYDASVLEQLPTQLKTSSKKA